ncbi:hypothetical protein PR048_025041 [Dryococelus australis]|uniref:C2H2-type domain-containing protein n=1 Tax=Dryococelus australis TaxID=614101 RepID=A0ABQ9GQD2_9NEOP|nr:hypothetical protein PR048_025041 [Dryococelus australis]
MNLLMTDTDKLARCPSVKHFMSKMHMYPSHSFLPSEMNMSLTIMKVLTNDKCTNFLTEVSLSLECSSGEWGEFSCRALEDEQGDDILYGMDRVGISKQKRDGVAVPSPSVLFAIASPDLNPIEHIWDELDRRVRACQAQPISIAQLMEWLREEWRRIPVDVQHTLVESMHKTTEGEEQPYHESNACVGDDTALGISVTTYNQAECPSSENHLRISAGSKAHQIKCHNKQDYGKLGTRDWGAEPDPRRPTCCNVTRRPSLTHGGIQEQGKRETTEKIHRPEASSGMIPTCENSGATLTGIEPGSPSLPYSTKLGNKLHPMTSSGTTSSIAAGLLQVCTVYNILLPDSKSQRRSLHSMTSCLLTESLDSWHTQEFTPCDLFRVYPSTGCPEESLQALRYQCYYCGNTFSNARRYESYHCLFSLAYKAFHCDAVFTCMDNLYNKGSKGNVCRSSGSETFANHTSAKLHEDSNCNHRLQDLPMRHSKHYGINRDIASNPSHSDIVCLEQEGSDKWLISSSLRGCARSSALPHEANIRESELSPYIT